MFRRYFLFLLMSAISCTAAFGKGAGEEKGAAGKSVAGANGTSAKKAQPEIEKPIQITVIKPSDPLFGRLEKFIVPYVADLYSHKRRGDVAKLSFGCIAMYQKSPSLLQVVVRAKGTRHQPGYRFEDVVDLYVIKDGERLKMKKAEVRTCAEHVVVPRPGSKPMPVEPEKPVEKI